MQVQPFAFDRVFPLGSPGCGQTADEMRLELEQLRIENERLKRDAAHAADAIRAAAFEEAATALRAERDEALLHAVDALQAGLEQLEEQFAETELRLAREAGALAVAAADYIAGRALELTPTLTIDAAISRALRQVSRGVPIHVRVHPDLVEPMEAVVAARQQRDRRQLELVVVGDAALVLGDARIDWDRGGLQLSAEARREAVAQEVDQLLPTP